MNIERVVSALKTAQAVHASLLKWDTASSRMVATCDEKTLHVAYVKTLTAERDYCTACDDYSGAEQMGYMIEDEIERFNSGRP